MSSAVYASGPPDRVKYRVYQHSNFNQERLAKKKKCTKDFFLKIEPALGLDTFYSRFKKNLNSLGNQFLLDSEIFNNLPILPFRS
jgi:hypothetical protein